MGSTTVYIATKGRTTRSLIEQELPETLYRNGRIVACGTSPYFDGESAFYAAVENNDGTRWALVVLYKRAPQSFWYKEMDEGMGPGADNAPKNVLLALEGSTPRNEHAVEWRADCWKNLRKAGQARTLAVAAVIRFTRGFVIDGKPETDFVVIDVKARLFCAKTSGRTVRLPKSWAQDAWSLVQA